MFESITENFGIDDSGLGWFKNNSTSFMRKSSFTPETVYVSLDILLSRVIQIHLILIYIFSEIERREGVMLRNNLLLIKYCQY